MAFILITLFATLSILNIANAAYERQLGYKKIPGILCSLADFGFSTSSNPARAITLLLITDNGASYFVPYCLFHAPFLCLFPSILISYFDINGQL